MARPRKCCRIEGEPGAVFFKPRGVPMTQLDSSLLGLDGFEALRLADLEGLHHADAAARMGVSRATFGRILQAARRAVADALVNGKAIGIITTPRQEKEGGTA